MPPAWGIAAASRRGCGGVPSPLPGASPIATRYLVKKDKSREASERLERCVAAMVYYHKDGGSWSAAGLVAEVARSLSAWCAAAGTGGGARESILSSLQGALVERFGDKDGLRVHRAFLRALGDVEATPEDD